MEADINHTVEKDGKVVRDSCDVLVAASGTQNTPLEPDVPGLSNFKGPVIHTGNW
jgi:cation diffusion facilitator CzcD-associated flavoprotein CzcO